MKRTALTLIPVAGLLGCGTLPPPHSSSAAAIQAESVSSGIDLAKVARIDRMARQHGIGIVWVNPPRLKVAVAMASGG